MKIKKSKEHLRTLGEIFQKAHVYLDALSADERRRLIEVSKRRNDTNCWYAEYDAAKWILGRFQ